MNLYRQRFKTSEERFWEKVDKRSDNECWNWTGAMSKGYGDFWIGRREKAHRYSWILHNGEIPDGMLVCHHCDNPKCVNPNHLFLGTIQDNSDDMMNKNRYKARIGSEVPTSKLKENEVKQIRRLYNSRLYTQKELAVKFGISFQQVSRIVNNKQWKSIIDELGDIILKANVPETGQTITFDYEVDYE